MRIAVVQQQLRDDPAADAEALWRAVERARLDGARFVVTPPVTAGDAIAPAPDAADGTFVLAPVPGAAADVLPGVGVGDSGEILGTVGLLVGDACMDPAGIATVAAAEPDVIVLCPESENDLQAEAVLEFALGLSEAAAGLVLVADRSGAEPGEPGHGGSAIVLLGDVVSEAGFGDDVLVADVALPIARPEPKEPLPVVPTILEQRLATHRGAKLPVDYPADLSDGAGQP